MNKINSQCTSEHDYAIESDENLFDGALPNDPIQISPDYKRIYYQFNNNRVKIISLNANNPYHKLLLKTYAVGFQSEWFQELTEHSRRAYLNITRLFFDWINSSGYETTDKNRYNILKDYESYLINERSRKTSPIPSIKKIIREGIANVSFKSDQDYEYLLKLLYLTKAGRSAEPNPPTLSRWFDIPWIRPIIGEQSYLLLDSPRRLFISFRITAATTLMWFLEQRRELLNSPKIEFDPSNLDWQYDWGPLVFKRVVKHDSKGAPLDELSKLAFIDLVQPRALLHLQTKLSKSGVKDLKKKISFGNCYSTPWQKPLFFHPDYLEKYSPVEELLCAWLAACETIQPTDIQKLKINDYAREYSHTGRLIAMECTYYKGRAGTQKSTEVLRGSDVWTRALDTYMTGLPSESLFSTQILSNRLLPKLSKKKDGISRNNIIGMLLDIWKLESVQTRLKREHQKLDASPIFTSAMLALSQSDVGYSYYNKHTKKNIDEYRALSARTLPPSLFSLTHIKNTAVHAQSDQYRDSDLINNHSHTTQTAKTSYLTDKNKEWVNQSGRITRLVLNDLQFVVFQPSVTAMEKKVRDIELRTKVIEAADNTDIAIRPLQQLSIAIESSKDLLIIDTVESALVLLHYIKQAEAKFQTLLSVRPDWVERNLIVELEWATRTLSRMKSSAHAQSIYSKVSQHLAPLFDHLIDTIE